MNQDNSKQQHLQLPLHQLLWAQELLFVWLCYCILFFVRVCVFMCVCQQLAFQRPPAFTVTPDDNAVVHKLHTRFFFPALPTGITICFTQRKHNAIIRAHYEATRFILSATGGKRSGDLTWQLLYKDKHFSLMHCWIFTCGVLQYQQHFTELLEGGKKYVRASPLMRDESH